MKLLFSLILFLSSAFISLGQATFNVTTSGTDATIDNAIDYSTDIWGQYLNSAVPIKIRVVYADLTGAGPLAITLPNGEKDFSAAPFPSIWYASCLANSIEGTEINTGENDMDIYVNSSTNYYFGTDGNPAPGQYDFVSVFLHEIAHGLGILSLSEVENGEGSFGYVDASNVFPLQASFPFPVLEGLPSIWDKFIENGNGNQLIDQTLYANPSAPLQTEFEGNDLFFTGSNATAANWGVNPKMYAPSTYAYGSSMQHFNNASFPLSSGNSMMTPSIGSGEVEHSPGGILIGALEDIGWSTNIVGLDENSLGLEIALYPNPVSELLQLNFGNPNEESVELVITSCTGGEVMSYVTTSEMVNIDVSGWSSGVYFCAVLGEVKNGYVRFVKE